MQLKKQVKEIGLDPFEFSSRDMVYKAYNGEKLPMAELLYGIAENGGSLDAIFKEEEKRSIIKRSGLTEEESLIIAEWFDKNPEIRDLIVAWARARLTDELSGVEADLLEFDAKAKASYLLEKLQRKEKKKIPRGQ